MDPGLPVAKALIVSSWIAFHLTGMMFRNMEWRTIWIHSSCNQGIDTWKMVFLNHV